MSNRTNWLAIAASVVVSMVVGFLWYGVIFAKQWMDGNGITVNEDDTKFFKDGVEMDMSNTPMILNTLFMLVYALIINWLLDKANARTLQSGAMIGLAIGVTHTLNVIVGNMFAANPSSLSMVDGSYNLVVFTLMGAILGGWQKK
ncbi:MAG: DUF1761 domain-containing protein [Saprospiraceae bacterium]|nr:DUF1761 domain-containing protein [Saprospiraceae bacterium]